MQCDSATEIENSSSQSFYPILHSIKRYEWRVELQYLMLPRQHVIKNQLDQLLSKFTLEQILEHRVVIRSLQIPYHLPMYISCCRIFTIKE